MERQWNFIFFLSRNHGESELWCVCVCVARPNCLRDDGGASSQPALCVPYVSAMSTHCRGGQQYAVFRHAMVVLHLSDQCIRLATPQQIHGIGQQDTRGTPSSWSNPEMHRCFW